MTPSLRRHTEWVGALHLLGVRILALVHLLTYSWFGAYKTGNISETVEDRAKATINGLHVHWLSIGPKCMTLNDL